MHIVQMLIVSAALYLFLSKPGHISAFLHVMFEALQMYERSQADTRRTS